MTPDYIQRRIEHAGATMRCLRIKHPSALLAQGRVEIIRQIGDYPDDKTRVNSYPMPSAQDITLMDEAFLWIILMIENRRKCRILSLRSQFCPVNKVSILSWRACGELMVADKNSVKLWHGQAIAYLGGRLATEYPISPNGCRVIPDHIALHWLESSAA